ncbi:hypothetical protein MFLAVUS_006368 [Mucor flavus]|uniref:Uncharacterized protein n=1 Tax=Mucor flavus TaxID=439312 RepID=A0ABP9Z1B2_9FUNG
MNNNIRKDKLPEWQVLGKMDYLKRKNPTLPEYQILTDATEQMRRPSNSAYKERSSSSRRTTRNEYCHMSREPRNNIVNMWKRERPLAVGGVTVVEPIETGLRRKTKSTTPLKNVMNSSEVSVTEKRIHKTLNSISSPIFIEDSDEEIMVISDEEDTGMSSDDSYYTAYEYFIQTDTMTNSYRHSRLTFATRPYAEDFFDKYPVQPSKATY